MTVAVLLLLVVPRPAAADITNQAPWTNLAVTTDRSTTISEDYTVTATPGSDRLLLVTMVTRFGFDQTIDVTSASFGGVQLHEIVEGSSLSTRNGVWMGYLLDSETPAGVQTLTVSFTSTVSDPTGTKLLAATYVGVDQTNPVNDSSANNTAVDAPITFGSQIDYVAGAEVVYVASYGGNTNLDTIEPAGYSKIYTNEWSGLLMTTIAHKDDTSTAGNSPGTTAVDFEGTDPNHSLAVVALSPSSTSDPQTIVLHPTSDGVPIQFGTYPFDSDNFDVVNDQTGNAGTGPPEPYDGANYLWGNIGQRAMLRLDDGTVPAGATITEISIHALTNRAGGQANLSLSYQRKAGATTPDASPIDGAGTDLGNACCTEIIETWSSLSWTTDDLDNLEIGTVQNSGDGDSRISQLYVLVSYVEGGSSASISGVVFEDADFAGTATAWDGGTNDAAQPNVDVELYTNSDTYIASATTAGDGSFTFINLADGTYKVRVRSTTIGDADTPPAGGLHPTVPVTWPYPLPDMTWGYNAAHIGGQDHSVDDTATGDNGGPGDTYVVITVSGADVTGVNFGFNYDLITNTDDDSNLDSVRSKQGSLRQFIKNSNAIVGVNKSWFQTLSP